MASSSVWRRPPVWVVAVLGAVVALAAVVIFGTTVQAQPSAPAASDLSISKTISPKKVKVGQRQVYTINISNISGQRLTGVRMRDRLPQGVRFLDARTTLQIPGSCRYNQSNRTVRCGSYTLRRGQSFTIYIYVKTVRQGTFRNVAYVSHRTAGFGAAPGATTPERSDAATHRAVKRDANTQRCGVKAVGSKNGAKACVGGVKATAKR